MKISTALLFIFLHVNLFSQASPETSHFAPEICNNEIDDDGDGLIDCYDVQDCPCDTVPNCVVTSMPASFGMQAAWISPQDNLTSWVTPLVGNLNPTQDSIPEIIVFKANNVIALPTEVLFFKGDGSDRNNPPKMTVPGGFSDPSIADLDRDGNVELFMVDHEKRLRVYHGYNPAANQAMQLWVISTDTIQSRLAHTHAADFDADGISEIYVGNEVYALDFSNPGAPQLKRILKGTGPTGGWSYFYNFYNSFAADLLTPADCGGDPDCNGLEIAAGFVIYSIDLDPNDGDGVQIKIQRNIKVSSGQNFSDGYTAVADVNLDGIPEVVVAGRLIQGNFPTDQSGVYVWNKTGFWKFMANPYEVALNDEETGVLTIANVYDDTEAGHAEDWPEIMSCTEGKLKCYNLHAANTTPAQPTWWAVNTEDLGQLPGVTSFDFDNNGISELVLQDQPYLRILYGGANLPAGVSGNNRNLATYHNKGVGLNQMAVIADVDADDEAEIVVIGGREIPNTIEYTSYGSLYVLESNRQNHRAWMPARDIWNQYSYNVVNINDDLTVPIVQQEGHLQIPAGSGQRPLNNFGFQAPKYGKPNNAYLPTADLQLELVSKSCNGTSLNITMRICNKGSIPFRDSMFLSFYRFGNPFSGNAIRGGTYLVRTTPFQPDSCLIFNVTLPNAPVNFYFLINDAGDTQIPLPGNLVFYTPECNYQNNNIQFSGYPKPTLNLGPDRTGCPPGGHTFIAGNGFATFLWQDGSTGPLFTAFASGKYWVEATDFCANVRRDTVEVFSNAVLQTLQVAACAGDTYLFDGQNIPAGSSQTFQYTSTLGCDSTIVVVVGILPAETSSEIRQICPGDSTLVFGNYVSVAGTFQQTNPNVNGCDSTHSITVTLFAMPQNTQENRQICPGDSTLVFGNYVSVAGTFQQTNPNVTGCDSTHSIIVSLFPMPQNTQENRQICAGDSTLVFGNYVSLAGTFQQTSPNINGCDSTHSITVSLFPMPQNTQENRLICPGDSTLVFGNYVSVAGTFQQTSPNVNGCDSTHSIIVSLFAMPQNTQENRQICPGDSTLVFGNYVSVAGTFQQTSPNINGCDSTHSITVSLFAMPQNTQENRQICPGDSTLVFGNYVSGAGTFQQTNPNINGCDSTHSITVSLFAMPQNTQENRQICPGDSTLIFGNYVSGAGTFQQTNPNINGCDSTHSITVSLFAMPQNTQENRQICPGDSTLVFGNYVSVAGTFQQTSPNINGCDSTHSITVSLFAMPQNTQESRQICPGDSTLVFGNYVSVAGTFQQTSPNINGCDSTHSITVSLFAMPQNTQENRQICPGDSTLIFGNYVSGAGTFQQTSPNINGCDSTHSITVSLFTMPQNTQENRLICPGDSTLVFGNFVSAAGTFQQTNPNVTGCDSTHTIEVNLVPQYIWDMEVIQPTCRDTLGKVAFTLPAPAPLFSLNGVPFSRDTVFDKAPAGSYTLYVNNEGCLDTTFFELLPAIIPELHLPADTAIQLGQSVLLQPEFPQNGAYLFDWKPAQYLSCADCATPLASPSESTIYTLLITDDEGCFATDKIRINIRQPSVYAPNVFRPNSDNGHDYFTLYADPTAVDKIELLQIFDRWGSLVFERKDFFPNTDEMGWDGYFRGKALDSGVYIWHAKIILRGAETSYMHGDVLLLR